MRKGDACTEILCENRVRLAMHILESFQDSWPAVIWTRHFLECLLNNTPEDTARDADMESATHSEMAKPSMTQWRVGSSVVEHRVVEQNAASGQMETEYQDPNAYGSSFQTPQMPLFSFNDVAEDMGINPDTLLFDISNTHFS